MMEAYPKPFSLIYKCNLRFKQKTRLLAALLGVGTQARARCATGSWPLSGRCAHRNCSRTGFLSVLEYRPISAGSRCCWRRDRVVTRSPAGSQDSLAGKQTVRTLFGWRMCTPTRQDLTAATCVNLQSHACGAAHGTGMHRTVCSRCSCGSRKMHPLQCMPSQSPVVAAAAGAVSA